MYAEALIEKHAIRGGDAADVEKLRAILDGGQRIQRLARDLVTYARPTGSTIEPVDLSGVVDEGLRLAKQALKEAGAVVLREPGEAPVVNGNRPSLVQVVLALVTNAAQAVASGGQVRVRLDGADELAMLTVTDDGAGMSDEVRRRAFEPFFSTKTAVGIGLGLPIVQEIVERHGGTVSLASEEGKGTVVVVAIPVHGTGAYPRR
ncbi:MAG: HAMP domain-containing sensor histidine kinase [Anaeromyxobacter sp.]